MTIYEIDNAILECIDPETGEVDAEKLTALQMERDTKIENIANLIHDLDGDTAKIDAEIKRLNELKKQKQNRIASLKDYLRYVLQDTAYKRGTVNIQFRHTRSVADMTDEEVRMLPEEFVIQTVTIKPDKRKLQKAVDEGWRISGVKVNENVSVIVK